MTDAVEKAIQSLGEKIRKIEFTVPEDPLVFRLWSAVKIQYDEAGASCGDCKYQFALVKARFSNNESEEDEMPFVSEPDPGSEDDIYSTLLAVDVCSAYRLKTTFFENYVKWYVLNYGEENTEESEMPRRWKLASTENKYNVFFADVFNNRWLFIYETYKEYFLSGKEKYYELCLMPNTFASAIAACEETFGAAGKDNILQKLAAAVKEDDGIVYLSQELTVKYDSYEISGHPQNFTSEYPYTHYSQITTVILHNAAGGEESDVLYPEKTFLSVEIEFDNGDAIKTKTDVSGLNINDCFVRVFSEILEQKKDILIIWRRQLFGLAGLGFSFFAEFIYEPTEEKNQDFFAYVEWITLSPVSKLGIPPLTTDGKLRLSGFFCSETGERGEGIVDIGFPPLSAIKKPVFYHAINFSFNFRKALPYENRVPYDFGIWTDWIYQNGILSECQYASSAYKVGTISDMRKQ